jgi:hypothetical protein
MNFKLDNDEGNWLLTFEGHDSTITVVMTDNEAFELYDTLDKVQDRRAYIADQMQIARGASLAGFLEQPWIARGVED